MQSELMPTPRLNVIRSALLVIDVQEKLVPTIHEKEVLLRRAGRLIDGFNELDLPVLATEQYRAGLGETVPELGRRLPRDRCVFEKLKFSACIEPVRQRLSESNTRSVVLAGIEAHVCVLQTAIDLVDAGYVTAVAVDATASRRSIDKEMAIKRMIQVGVIPTTVESALFELTHEAGTERFRRIHKMIK